MKKKDPSGRQNLTVKLGKGAIRKAKVLAAQKGTSISRLVSGYIEQMVKDEEAFVSAREKAMTYLGKGFHFGGCIDSKRDDWHER